MTPPKPKRIWVELPPADRVVVIDHEGRGLFITRAVLKDVRNASQMILDELAHRPKPRY